MLSIQSFDQILIRRLKYLFIRMFFIMESVGGNIQARELNSGTLADKNTGSVRSLCSLHTFLDIDRSPIDVLTLPSSPDHFGPCIGSHHRNF